MDTIEKLMRAKIETFMLLKQDNIKHNDESYESPYLYVIDRLEEIIVEMLGLQETTIETMNEEAIDEAERILKLINME